MKNVEVHMSFIRGISEFTGHFQVASVVKNLPANPGDAGLIPGSERSPGEVNDNPLQYSCLGNPMDRGVWWATVHGITRVRVRHDLATNNPNG